MTLQDQLVSTTSQIAFIKSLEPLIQLKIGRWEPSLLQKDLNLILSRIPFHELNQINLTSPFETEQNPYDGLGYIEPRIENGVNNSELYFHFFNSDFKDTVFFEIFKKLQKSSPFPLGRVRLMRLYKKSCYTVHQDGSLRFHLPIITNSETYFCFDKYGFYHLPAEGHVFCTNTLLRHTVVNGGNTERIHLVFSTSWKECSMEKIKSFLSL